MKHLFTYLLLLLSGFSVQAQTITWTGGTSSDWNTPTNWNPNGVPTNSSDVIIPNVTNDPIIGSTSAVLARTVEVQFGAVLTIQNSATLTVNGSKSISSATTAFYNAGSVTNNGLVSIGATAAVGQYGLLNQFGTVTNNSSGQIQINRSTTAGLYNQFNATFNNAGSIVVGATASVGQNALLNQVGTFNNLTGGQIQLDNSITAGLLNTLGTFTNSARIVIGSTSAVGQSGLANQGNFANNTGGQIEIDRSSTYGLANLAGSFTNVAGIRIGATASVGQNGLYNYATFNNNTGGQIQIDNSTEIGLRNEGGTFTNAASIIIGATGPVGVYGLGNQATFTNSAGGQIQIDNATQAGLFNLTGIFTNSARIVIGATGPVGVYGLRNQTSFTNAACASLTLFAPVGNAATFTNQGFLTVNTTQAHLNSGTLTNNGTIVYPQGNPIPGVINNKITALPITTSCELTASPALQVGGSNNLQVSTTWSKDEALTTPAGTYDANTNTFTVSSPATGGTYPLYFTVNDPQGSCSQVVSIPVTVNLPPAPTLVSSGTITCANPTVTIVATPADQSNYSFTGPLFTQNSTSATAVVSQEGSYSVVVTAANGCTALATTTVSSNTIAPEATLSSSATITCATPTVTLIATPAEQSNYAFTGPLLSQSGTSSTAVVSQEGSYSVVVTGANGCTALTTTTVSSNTIAPTVSLTNTGPISFTNATSTLVAVSSDNVSYSFSPGAIQQGMSNMAQVSTPGIYSVTVTRLDNGCTATASTTVTGGNSPTVCRGGTAVINVAVDGDPVKYEWYKNSLSTPKIMETPQLFRGTATSSLTLINAQTNTQGNFFLKVTDRSGTVKIYGPYRLTVDASCRAREIAQLETPLQVELAPNPIQQDRLRAIVRGAEGHSLQVELVDLNGKPIRQQRWSQAQAEHLIDWDMQGQTSAVYILQVVRGAGAGMPAQRQSVKVIKP
ncbi:hypothetical protein [Spirosoma fluminis]